MRSFATVPALLAVAALVAGCGTETAPARSTASDEPPAPLARPSEVPPASGEVTTTYPVTVLDDGDGAELCPGGVMESYPPQCGGVPLVGWDWTQHRGDHETAGEVRWGDFVVVGRFDGGEMTPTSVVPAAEWEAPASREVDEVGEVDAFATPCPEPAGGWRPVDPATTTEEARARASRVAQALLTFGGMWVDQSINPAAGQGLDPGSGGGGLDWELAMNDPLLLVLNVRVTDDVPGAEASLREVWGGALCVSEAERTEAELRRIQEEVLDLPGYLTAGTGRDVVELGVVHDDGSIQAWADQEHGEGAVEVVSALRPVG